MAVKNEKGSIDEMEPFGSQSTMTFKCLFKLAEGMST
jgi:hypothetical protein